MAYEIIKVKEQAKRVTILSEVGANKGKYTTISAAKEAVNPALILLKYIATARGIPMQEAAKKGMCSGAPIFFSKKKFLSFVWLYLTWVSPFS